MYKTNPHYTLWQHINARIHTAPYINLPPKRLKVMNLFSLPTARNSFNSYHLHEPQESFSESSMTPTTCTNLQAVLENMLRGSFINSGADCTPHYFTHEPARTRRNVGRVLRRLIQPYHRHETHEFFSLFSGGFRSEVRKNPVGARTDRCGQCGIRPVPTEFLFTVRLVHAAAEANLYGRGGQDNSSCGYMPKG